MIQNDWQIFSRNNNIKKLNTHGNKPYAALALLLGSILIALTYCQYNIIK